MQWWHRKIALSSSPLHKWMHGVVMTHKLRFSFPEEMSGKLSAGFEKADKPSALDGVISLDPLAQ